MTTPDTVDYDDSQYDLVDDEDGEHCGVCWSEDDDVDCVHCECCCTCLGCEYGPRDGMLMFPEGVELP